MSWFHNKGLRRDFDSALDDGFGDSLAQVFTEWRWDSMDDIDVGKRNWLDWQDFLLLLVGIRFGCEATQWGFDQRSLWLNSFDCKILVSGDHWFQLNFLRWFWKWSDFFSFGFFLDYLGRWCRLLLFLIFLMHNSLQNQVCLSRIFLGKSLWFFGNSRYYRLFNSRHYNWFNLKFLLDRFKSDFLQSWSLILLWKYSWLLWQFNLRFCHSF